MSYWVSDANTNCPLCLLNLLCGLTINLLVVLQDAPSWSLLKTALNSTPNGDKQDDEDGMGYYYAVSNPSYSLEKRYVCDFAGCNYTSSRKYNLMRHGRTHHEDQRIPCPECPGTFVDKYILKEHMASAHAKFTIPIEGTNMIGVGISCSVKSEGGFPAYVPAPPEPLIGPLLEGAERPMVTPSPHGFTNKRKRSTPSHNPNHRRSFGPMNKPKPLNSSPGNSQKKSGGWHIPRLGPMVAGKMGSPSFSSVEQMMSIMKQENSSASYLKQENSNSSMGSCLSEMEQNNNNIMSKESLASMQVVFPGMVDMRMMDMDNNNTTKKDDASPSSPRASAAMDLTSSMQVVFPGMVDMRLMDIDNNNTPKKDDASPPSPGSSATDLTSSMQVVFPGMEMVQQEDSNGPESTEVSPIKERSMIETSDGEDAKISE